MVGREKVDINKTYASYKSRIEQRIKSGEKELKLKTRTEWQKVVEKEVDGKTVKVTISGESGETSQEKAKRLGNVRLNKVLSSMKALKTLAISSQYKFTGEQVTYITAKVNDAAIDVIASFEGKTTETKEKIELP